MLTRLFAGDGTDLKTPLRDGSSDDDLCAQFQIASTVRTHRYSEERAGLIDESGLPSQRPQSGDVPNRRPTAKG